MDQSAHMRVIAWCQTNPRIVSYLDSLNRQSVDWAIYSGALVALLAGSRLPADLDIIVSPATFDKAVNLSPPDAGGPSKGRFCRCGDGLVLDFPAKGISFELGGQEIDLMAT